MKDQEKFQLSQILKLPVIVAALGYLVDMYDIFLFSVVRKPSLEALGVIENNLLPQGVYLLNMQLIGMLMGGLI